MGIPWRLELTYPSTSINKRIKYLHGKARFTEKGKEHNESRKRFRSDVWLLYKSSKLPTWGKKTLKVTLELHYPDKRHRDVDSCLKEILDALQDAGVYEDDYQIRKLTVERMDDVVKLGKVIVMIEECE